MFTGIIEAIGTVSNLVRSQSNLHITLISPFTHELKVDQSVAHNGVCLTVVAIKGNEYTVTAIEETLRKTNLNALQLNDSVNLERCMPANGRFDGHIVQGHVDETAVCENVSDENGSWLFTFKLEQPENTKYIVDKGSITINGISLTVVSCKNNVFTVAIIPYTYEHTNLHAVNTGTKVNIEFDIIGKYVAKMVGK
ncbi:MAG: riboflavin synthase [Bacteroidetes bacterium]|nr:MAG: riboflavin synthase [Bacteroidota bacterium]